MKDVTFFINELNKIFSASEGIFVDYNRNDNSISQLSIWMQKYLDELSITEFSFLVQNGIIVVKSFKYELDPLGFDYLHFPYLIELNNEKNEFVPENIKSVSINFR
jgi:hypothetical protein